MLSPLSRYFNAGGAAAYFGWLIMMRLSACIAIILIILVAGCAHVPVPVDALRQRAGEGGYHVTIIRSYGPLQVVQALSWLPGAPLTSRVHTVYQLRDRGPRILIQAPVGGPGFEAGFLPRYARMLAEVPATLASTTGVSPSVREITVILIPPGTGFESRSTSLGGRRVTFALRTYPNPEHTLSDSIRTIVHELLHSGVALAGGLATGYEQELAAVTAESCVELMLRGETAGVMPRQVGRDVVADQHLLTQTGVLGASETATYGADPERRELFKAGPIHSTDTARADALYALCKKRVRQLMPAATS